MKEKSCWLPRDEPSRRVNSLIVRFLLGLKFNCRTTLWQPPLWQVTVAHLPGLLAVTCRSSTASSPVPPNMATASMANRARPGTGATSRSSPQG